MQPVQYSYRVPGAPANFVNFGYRVGTQTFTGPNALQRAESYADNLIEQQRENEAAQIQVDAINEAAQVGQFQAPQQAPQAPAPDAAAATFSALRAVGQNLPQVQQLTSQLNGLTQAEQNRLSEQAMPGFTETRDAFVQEAKRTLESSSKLPKSIQDSLVQFAAENAIGRGTSGQFNDFDVMQDLGINTLQYQQSQQQMAQQLFSTANQFTSRINAFSPFNFLLSPSQLMESQQQYNQGLQDSNQAYLNAFTATQNANAQLVSQSIIAAGGVRAGAVTGG